MSNLSEKLSVNQKMVGKKVFVCEPNCRVWYGIVSGVEDAETLLVKAVGDACDVKVSIFDVRSLD